MPTLVRLRSSAQAGASVGRVSRVFAASAYACATARRQPTSPFPHAGVPRRRTALHKSSEAASRSRDDPRLTKRRGREPDPHGDPEPERADTVARVRRQGGLRSRPVDVGKLLQENAGVVGIVGAVVGFVASQLVQIRRDHQAEQRAISTELRADKRAQRDQKLARMRTAFKPVILAAWALQTAGNEFFLSAGDPRVTAAAILEGLSMDRINEARADLLLEGDVRDVFDELQRMHTAFAHIRLVIDRHEESIATDLETLKNGRAKIENLVDDHLRAVERSAV